MKRLHVISSINARPAIRAKPRLIAGACCLLIALAISNARRDHDLHVRTTVELRVSEQWLPC